MPRVYYELHPSSNNSDVMLYYVMISYVMGNSVSVPTFLDLTCFRLREHILWKIYLKQGSLIQDGHQFEDL
jgi:hypothetical protein